jgi:hypothetical protein
MNNFANSTYESYNHPNILFHKNFKRMVVYAFVYHKYLKSRGCFGTSLAARTANVELIVIKT